MKNLFAFVFIIIGFWSTAQLQTHYVPPVLTDSNYSPTEDSSSVSINMSNEQNRMFLFIGGTWSSSSNDYPSLRLYCANLGFHFISLSYPNDVAAASLANNSDSMAFNNYRQELCFGTPLSSEVAVDTFNSIYTRALKLVQYLSTAYPSENWGQYLLTPTTLDWSKIVVGGHSQGSGHACYLAKSLPVERVLMFSGPNDYSTFYSNSANWLRTPGITSILKHFAYLSLNDETVTFDKQYVNQDGLGMLDNDDTTFVDNSSPPYGNSHFLYTIQAPGIALLNHNVPVMFSSINTDVWEYMLLSPTLSTEDLVQKADFSISPNPANQQIQIRTSQEIKGKTGTILNVKGQTVLTFTINPECLIDITTLDKGYYYIQLNGITSQFIKE